MYELLMIHLFIMGFATKNVAKKRGYTGGYWWGFLLGVFGLIVVGLWPVKPPNYEQSKAEE